MRKFITVICITMCLLFFARQAHAVFIIDTGMPPDSSGGSSLSSNQSLSGQFNISGRYTLNSIEGWLNVRQGGNVVLSLYRESGLLDAFDRPLPDTSSALYSAAFNPSAMIGWQGASGLGWNLNPGTYWIEFGLAEQSNFAGFMPVDAPNALAHYAFYDVDADLYRGMTSEFGVRIDANAIPEPGTMLLFASGILGAYLRKIKKFKGEQL